MENADEFARNEIRDIKKPSGLSRSGVFLLRCMHRDFSFVKSVLSG